VNVGHIESLTSASVTVRHQQSRETHLKISDIVFSVVAVILFQDWLHSGGHLYSPCKVRGTLKVAVKQAGNFIASRSDRQVCTVLVERFNFLILLSCGISCR
jgi:hypothetical protein